jgi:hypothetical protein
LSSFLPNPLGSTHPLPWRPKPCIESHLSPHSASFSRFHFRNPLRRIERLRSTGSCSHLQKEEMTHYITLSPDKSFVILTVRGTITAAAALECNREAHLFAFNHGVSRHLMDLRGCRNGDSVACNLHFSLYGMQNEPAIDKHARVALLVDPDDHSHDFIKAAVQCAGLDVYLFTDLAIAEKHLTSDP